ncbi:MAG: UvrB/UvrC motif-containing protein [Candidatus Krumholzibacteria bacterium]|nr:UvrB/UvrC motif-containing protein [Candidatus Krumholzibacteria bacterium]
MVCQFCKKREATIHFTNVIGNRIEKIHICTSCADEKGFDYLKKSNFEKGDLLAGLMNLAFQAGSPEAASRRCGGCGRTYADFKKTGKLGCSQCYEVFREELEQILTSVHGDTCHKGKVPGRQGSRIDLMKKIHDLQKELRTMIELEQYERAAEIRDEITCLKNTGGGGAGKEPPCPSGKEGSAELGGQA